MNWAKLVKRDLGRYVDKEKMAKDHVLPQRNCFCAYVKTDISNLDENFFTLVPDKDCTKELYTTNYDKPMDDSLKKVAFKYAQDKDTFKISPCQDDTESKNLFKYCTSCIFLNEMYGVQIFNINIR